MTYKIIICRIALAVPLHKQFDYYVDSHLLAESLKHSPKALVGCRVRVPFGRKRQVIGVIYSVDPKIDYPIEKIKKITQLIDQKSLLSSNLWALLNWSSKYYQHTFGEVFQQAIPRLLRQGKAPLFKNEEYWKIANNIDIQCVKRAKKQYQTLELLSKAPLSRTAIKKAGISSATLKTLKEKNLIDVYEKQPITNLNWGSRFHESDTKPVLNTEQVVAINAINQHNKTFNCFLLEGVTGSGKSEVYLNILKPILKEGRQALIIVPEIGLTSQTIQSVKSRFNVPVYLKHSALNAQQQLDAWMHAKQGSAAIIIGTRSAIFSDFKQLGMIIIDEEHDASFKQHDSFRYHARDFAIKRAHREGIPIILGSATPAFETLHNALEGKYQHLELTKRAGKAKLPLISIINLAGLSLQAGLSPQLIELIRAHLSKNNQIIIFLNRRGYAPVLMCHECGWLVKCSHCNAFYTYHKSDNYLHCHHCASRHSIPRQCAECGSTQIQSTGIGTEQLEEKLKQLFPNYPTIRIDRDNTRKKESFNQYLSDINSGKYKILLGTQMLAKGHHFPEVTLTALVDVDGALFCNDFRSSERLAQLFTQVSGRTGRGEKQGQVILQTHYPEHKFLQDLTNEGYANFSRSALKERAISLLPPFSFQALIRCASEYSDHAEQFLLQCKQTINKISSSNNFTTRLFILGPMPAPMNKRAGRFRFQLLLQSDDRSLITQILQQAQPAMCALPKGRKTRWSIDVDPFDFV
ncbi:MAG: primosomal protein N' [Psychromonas sp.]|nr:primosomal protein N' [Psychromonas sp.]